ncbi:hypothetical protein E2R51_03935 [Jeotgalibacillus sp. S-D1]|uniref:DUF4139 domain-containing protein n=1 Tax=Jeotgalibacillus sp. S-D1 TaxID=2552189 RepID=UPI00105A37EB|nr:hypothetical protein [Jeotgalibacillus sp. S-D1]TDL34882.1 hypothetical protein E2R51_03935 [Jeotgalibacillus sp. S-D1]
MVLPKANSESSMHLVIYENNFAVVREKRSVPHPLTDRLQISNLPAKIDEQSVILKGLKVKKWTIQLSSQISEEAILKTLEGEIILFGPHDSEKKQYQLISYTPDLIIQNPATKELLLNPEGEISVLSLPLSVHSNPHYQFDIDPKQAPQTYDLTYILNDISWHARYIAVLNGTAMTLEGTIVVENDTGSQFPGVSIQTMAGETNRMREIKPAAYPGEPKLMGMMESGQEISEEGQGDLHLYTIPYAVTLKPRESNVFPFIQSVQSYRIFYVTSPSVDHPITTIEWTHSSAVPLAKGKITFYYEHQNQQLFAGEDLLPYTPKAKEVQLELGRAVDIDSEHELIKSYAVGEDIIEDHVFRLTNRKEQEAELIIEYPIHQNTWELVQASEEVFYQSARLLKLKTVLKPGESKNVTFSIKIMKRTKRF